MHFTLYKLQDTVTGFGGRTLSRYEMLPKLVKENSQHTQLPPSKLSCPAAQQCGV